MKNIYFHTLHTTNDLFNNDKFYILFVNLENNNKNTQFALQIHANVSQISSHMYKLTRATSVMRQLC